MTWMALQAAGRIRVCAELRGGDRYSKITVSRLATGRKLGRRRRSSEGPALRHTLACTACGHVAAQAAMIRLRLADLQVPIWKMALRLELIECVILD
jgi:hypothetical protein